MTFAQVLRGGGHREVISLPDSAISPPWGRRIDRVFLLLTRSCEPRTSLKHSVNRLITPYRFITKRVVLIVPQRGGCWWSHSPPGVNNISPPRLPWITLSLLPPPGEPVARLAAPPPLSSFLTHHRQRPPCCPSRLSPHTRHRRFHRDGKQLPNRPVLDTAMPITFLKSAV